MQATSSVRTIEVTEGTPWATLRVSIEQAAAIAALKIGSITPLSNGEWRITGIRKIGVLRIDDVELRIHPKTQIDRLFYLLARGNQCGEWFDEDVLLSTADSLYPAIAEVFGRWGDRVLRGGVLQGYQERRSAEPFIRGRWLVTEQIGRRFGMPLPAELAYDEYTTDIAENQLVRSAARRLLSLGSLPSHVSARLHRVDRRLANVKLLTRGADLPPVRFDRRNERYRPLIALARLVLGDESLEYLGGTSSASGYLLNVAAVFEDFVAAEVARHARVFGGEVISQHMSDLDFAGHVTIKPDLVWRSGGRVRAVFDAKYKVVKNDAYPNADVYQMLAYCIRHNVPEGHLIYAMGQPIPQEIAVQSAGVDGSVVRIYGHAVDLSRPPVEIEARMQAITAHAIAVGHTTTLERV